MKLDDTIEILKLIDRCYDTDYTKNKDIIDDWYKVLRNYEFKDISLALENYMKYNTSFAPKVYDVVRNCQTIENKKLLDHAKTRCHLCMKEINLDDEEHIDRCLGVEFIATVARRFKSQEIDKEKYRNMPREEFNKYHLMAVKLVIEKSNNKLEVAMWKKYLENIN